ncbi:unnamed protein product [Boreogadus saida]
MKALIGPAACWSLGHGDVPAVLHSLHYFYTGSSGLSTFPEFVAVGMVDGVQMLHYDSVSKRAVPKQDWMERYTRDNPDYLEGQTGGLQGQQQWFKVNIGIAKQRFNQTGEESPPPQWCAMLQGSIEPTEQVVVFLRRDGQALHEAGGRGGPPHHSTRDLPVRVTLNLTKAVPQEDWGEVYLDTAEATGFRQATQTSWFLTQTSSENTEGQIRLLRPNL